MEKLLILAKDYAQAERWAYTHGFRSHAQFRYIRDQYDLRGRRGQKFVKVGNYYDRRDWYALHMFLEVAGLVQVDADTYIHNPQCPFCLRPFTDEERGQQEFTPPHPSTNRILAERGQNCRGTGEPLKYGSI